MNGMLVISRHKKTPLVKLKTSGELRYSKIKSNKLKEIISIKKIKNATLHNNQGGFSNIQIVYSKLF